MPVLTIKFKFMMLVHNHSTGVNVLLPSSGHDAFLRINGASIPLNGCEVTLWKNGARMHGRRMSSVGTETAAVEYANLKTIYGALGASLPTSSFAPRRELLTDPISRLRELNARVLLPDGSITFTAPTDGAKNARWRFKAEISNHVVYEVAPSDTWRLEVNLSTEATYALAVESAAGVAQFPLTHDTTVSIENPDRLTADQGLRPWYEIRYLLDLLALPISRYPIPDPAPLSSPEVPRCPPLYSES